MHGNVNFFPQKEEAHGWKAANNYFSGKEGQECRRQLNADDAKLMRLTEILQKLFISVDREDKIKIIFKMCLLNALKGPPFLFSFMAFSSASVLHQVIMWGIGR